MRRDGIQFHNVETLQSVDRRNGNRIQRVPERVRTALNDGAATRMCHPAGVELRFVPDEPGRISLSSDVRDSKIRPFWGGFQAADAMIRIGENLARRPDELTAFERTDE
jgi:hypothetical protein